MGKSRPGVRSRFGDGWEGVLDFLALLLAPDCCSVLSGKPAVPASRRGLFRFYGWLIGDRKRTAVLARSSVLSDDSVIPSSLTGRLNGNSEASILGYSALSSTNRPVNRDCTAHLRRRDQLVNDMKIRKHPGFLSEQYLPASDAIP